MARGGMLGNWQDGLTKLLTRMQDIADKSAHEALIGRAAKVIGSQQKRQFRRGIGPDAAAWPAPKDGGKPMVRSKNLSKSGYAHPEPGPIVRFGFARRYAGIVNAGTKIMAARKIMPADGQNLGPVWGPRVIGSLRQRLGQLLRGRG